MSRVWKFGSHVNTDQIVPGRYAPYMTSEEKLREFPFIEARPEFAKEVQPGDVLVAGPNFGCGSSREYAARALALTEIAGILAPSFARIFYRNALNLGLPLIEAEAGFLADGAEVELDLARAELVHAGGVLALPPPGPFVRALWAEGGLLAYYAKHGGLPAEVFA